MRVLEEFQDIAIRPGDVFVTKTRTEEHFNITKIISLEPKQPHN